MSLMRSWSEFNRILLQKGQSNHARIWYGLRIIDAANKGWVLEQEAREFLVDSLDLGMKQTNSLIRGAEPDWISENEKIIHISSQVKIARNLGTKLGFAVDIPTNSLANIAIFRATLFSTWFARDTWRQIDGGRPAGGKTISIAKLCMLFGASESTIRRWIRIANMHTESQFAYVDAIDEKTYIPKHVIEKGLAFNRQGNNGRLGIAWQLPNRYSTPNLSADRKRWQDNKTGRLYSETEAKPSRVVFESERAYVNSRAASKQGETAYLLQKSRKKGCKWYVQVTT